MVFYRKYVKVNEMIKGVTSLSLSIKKRFNNSLIPKHSFDDIKKSYKKR